MVVFLNHELCLLSQMDNANSGKIIMRIQREEEPRRGVGVWEGGAGVRDGWRSANCSPDSRVICASRRCTVWDFGAFISSFAHGVGSFEGRALSLS